MKIKPNYIFQRRFCLLSFVKMKKSTEQKERKKGKLYINLPCSLVASVDPTFPKHISNSKYNTIMSADPHVRSLLSTDLFRLE